MKTQRENAFWVSRKLSPGNQVLFGFGLAIVLLIALGWVFSMTTSRFVDTSREAIYRAGLIAPIKRVFKLTDEAESAQHSYLFTAADFYLARRHKALRDVKRTFPELYAKARGHPRLTARVKRLEALANRRIEFLDQVLAMGRSSAGEARDLLATGGGDALQAEVEAMVSEQQQILHNKIKAAEHEGTRVLVICYIALGFGVVVLLVLMYFIRQALWARESAHAALARSQAQLKTIVDTAVDAIIVIDETGRIESFNQSAERMFGYAANEALARNVSMLMPSPHREQHDGYLNRYLRTGEKRVIGRGRDLLGQRKNGDVFPIELAVAESSAAERRLFTGLLRDITERKQGEEALRESERRLRALSESLEQQVEVRTAALQRQTAQLQRLTGELTSAEQRERKRLAAILHDGLQQLLVAAQIRLGQVRQQARDPAAVTAIKGVAELIGEAVSASRNLTHQLRPPALYEGGLLPALRWFAAELPKLHELQVVIEAEETEPALSDELKALLFESVRELLFNVAKHAGINEATVRVHYEGERLQIAVEDKGCGFDVGPVVHRRDPECAGLGLFSIRERLAAMGGDMVIEAIPGGGASIRLTAPLVRVEDEEATARTEPFSPTVWPQAAKPSAGDRPTRVLVADDHAIVREGIAHVLSSDERLMVVSEAVDGVEVLEAVARHRPDVVLIDVNMPRMNGVEATREIRRRWPNVRVVAISVQDDATTARMMLKAGAAAFVSKSDDPGQMIHAVLATGEKG